MCKQFEGARPVDSLSTGEEILAPFSLSSEMTQGIKGPDSAT